MARVRQAKLMEQYKAYKLMYKAQPQRIRDLFGDRITEIQRKNQVTKQKEAVKFEVFKFNKNLSTIPKSRKTKQQD